jgi:hypothetical protein
LKNQQVHTHWGFFFLFIITSLSIFTDVHLRPRGREKKKFLIVNNKNGGGDGGGQGKQRNNEK